MVTLVYEPPSVNRTRLYWLKLTTEALFAVPTGAIMESAKTLVVAAQMRINEAKDASRSLLIDIGIPPVGDTEKAFCEMFSR